MGYRKYNQLSNVQKVSLNKDIKMKAEKTFKKQGKQRIQKRRSVLGTPSPAKSPNTSRKSHNSGDNLLGDCNDDNLNFSNYMSSQGSDFITGKNGRRIKRFSSI